MTDMIQEERRGSNAVVVRRTNFDDLDRLQEIFAVAREFMRSTGNPNQWVEDYPSEDLLRSDVKSGDSYVVQSQGRVVATFVLRGGVDLTYNIIYDGQWLSDEPHATIHRVASSGEVKNVFGIAMHYALGLYDSIRIDTHRDNSVMQHIIERYGFKYCGIIHCWNGDERLAYQFIKGEW